MKARWVVGEKQEAEMWRVGMTESESEAGEAKSHQAHSDGLGGDPV